MNAPRTLFCAALVAAAAVVCATPARAVDRSLGADVPKPVVTGTPWTDAEITSLSANLDLDLAGAKTLRGAHVGIYMIDARDGRVLYERNADDAFQPASTFKLVTGNAALDTLGPAFRFHTEVVANGPVANGGLQGDLILRGGGDPFLNMHDLDAAADAVAKAGITRVDRDVAIDDAHFEPPSYQPGWNWDDFPYYYAPLISGLTFEENVVSLAISPGATVGAPVQVTATPVGTVGVPLASCSPDVGVRVVVDATTGAADAKDTIDIDRLPSGCIRVTGTIPLGAKVDHVDAAVPSPAAYAYAAFVAALQAHGVQVQSVPAMTGPWPSAYEHRFAGAASPAAKSVWSHDSEPLSDTLADLWLPSDNLVAELLLRQLGYADGGAPGTAAHGIAHEITWLKSLGIDTDAGLSVDDGSGLSVYDRITPRDEVTILKHEWDGPNRDLVLDDLPIAGVRGSLRRAFVGSAAEKHVFAKTGSVSHVSTLAGYLANAKHGAVIFAFQVDDWVGAASDLNDLRARFLSAVVEN
ncbi:MAG: D-alanyl-D-alanine carboxypeptidase/D-alanyl-D-alanine-endopeptidase [Candidatus Eremiobacteraeota bacterium]|nr:D-alanyl-D-alanine carboxypeptidase/D-alanyl-D-alanine-endopeptidase [Candidatus Eremiobacteraeota bacterium]